MSRYYIDPNTGQRVAIEKTHRIRNFVVLPLAGLVGLGIAISAINGGSAPTSVPTPAGVTPTEAVATSHSSYVEFFGDGEAMVSVMTQGHSSNTVTLPHRQDLPEGFASVTVTRTPSVKSYIEDGGPDSGTVGCRIVRDGSVVDEQTASGEFASATCSKVL